METTTFAKTIRLFEYHYDVRTVFADFLTLSLCAFSQNPVTKKSYEEDLYLETIAKYKDNNLHHEFPKLLACLSNEMTERVDSDSGNDVLGEFYEQNLQRKGLSQFFTPFHICKFMAKCTAESLEEKQKEKTLRILDPSCGSGRMLLASGLENGRFHEYYGIDVDQTCVKMATMNLFLNGLFHSEVLCADALLPEDFRISYKVSFLPFGVFRISEKERSPLWHMLKNSLPTIGKKNTAPPPDFGSTKHSEGSQMTIF